MAAFVASSVGNDTSSNTTVATAAQATTAGNLLVALFCSQEWAGQTYTAADTATNSYTNRVANAGNTGQTCILSAHNITANAANVITITASANERYKLAGQLEFSGIDTSAPYDDSDVAEASGATLITTPSMTASTSGVLVQVATSTNDRTWTIGGGATETYDWMASLGSNSGEHGYLILATSGSYTASTTASSASQLSLAAAIFKDAAGGGASYNAIPVLEYYQSFKRGGVFH